MTTKSSATTSLTFLPSSNSQEPPSAAGAILLGDTNVSAFWTGVEHGDQRPVVEEGKPPPDVVPRDVRVAGLRQVHGGTVVLVGDGANGVLPDGDAALAVDTVTCPVVLTADCVSIAIGSPEGIRVAVHAGWRGLVAGVVQGAAQAAMDAGASRLVAGIGPCIGPCCYEFTPVDLDRVEISLGPDVRSTTTWGSPALDVRLSARNALRMAGVSVVFEDKSCTACGGAWYSARTRGDIARQALYVWRNEDQS